MQIKEFVASIDGASRLNFAKKVANIDGYRATDGKPVYSKIATKCLAKEVLASLAAFRSDLKDLNG
jgi:hypothetical protein